MNLALVLEGREAARSGRGARLRQAAGLSQAELAAACGVSVAGLSRWELGQRQPRAAAAARYAEVLRELARFLARDTSDQLADSGTNARRRSGTRRATVRREVKHPSTVAQL